MSTKKISEIESKATSAEIGNAKLVAAIPSGDGHVTKYIEGNDLAYSMSPGMTIMEIKTIDDTNISTFNGTPQNFANWEPGDVFYFSDDHGWREVPANTSSGVQTANTRIQVYPVSDAGNFTLQRNGNVGLAWGRNYIHLRNSAGIVSGGTGGGFVDIFNISISRLGFQSSTIPNYVAGQRFVTFHNATQRLHELPTQEPAPSQEMQTGGTSPDLHMWNDNGTIRWFNNTGDASQFRSIMRFAG